MRLLALPRTRMRTQKYKATTRSARWIHCPFSKQVRAKVTMSPRVQNRAPLGAFFVRRGREISTTGTGHVVTESSLSAPILKVGLYVRLCSGRMRSKMMTC